MKFAFMQNPLTQIPFFARIYNSFIISHLLEWLKVRQIKSGIRVNFDQCVLHATQTNRLITGTANGRNESNTDVNIHAIKQLVTFGLTQCLHYSFYHFP